MKMVFNNPNPTATEAAKEKDPWRNARKTRQVCISCGVSSRRRWPPNNRVRPPTIRRRQSSGGKSIMIGGRRGRTGGRFGRGRRNILMNGKPQQKKLKKL